jgi:HlyD family secretion protein
MKRKYIYAGAGVLVLIIIIGFSVSSGGGTANNTITVHKQLFTNTISASGKVVAAQAVDLGFEQSGRVSKVYAQVGTSVAKGSTIAEIDNADLASQVEQKRATLEKEQAKLASLQQGTRKEELVIYQQKYDDATVNLTTAIHTARLQADDAILNKVDSLFTNGNTINPSLAIPVGNQSQSKALEMERYSVKNTLDTWSAAIAKGDLNTMRSVSTSALLSTKTFIDHLTQAVAGLSPSNSALSQASIDTYRLTLNIAGQTITAGMTSLQTTDATWSSARDTLALENAGATSNDITAQIAQVNSAEADMQNAWALLGKKIITAPFDGIITKMDLKVGQIVSPNTSEVSEISDGIFQIETFIPEVNIAAISKDNAATVTLDAYGQDSTFTAKVILVDPGETIRDGVSTYKVTLAFDAKDDRIRSGMTANAAIITQSKPDTIVVPVGVIIKKDDASYIQVKTKSGTNTVEVKTGISSNAGQIEIVSGLNDGDAVILNPKM